MLGRTRRTTRTDVSLALTMAGFVYLAWVFACWTAAAAATGLMKEPDATLTSLATGFVNTFGSWGRHVFDIVGPLWMLGSLYLVIRASRQHRIISWSWLLISCQGIAAILIAAWATLSHAGMYSPQSPTLPPAANWLPTVVTIAVLIWFGTLGWLIFERLRLGRGPAIRDGAKTHAYRR